MAEGAAPDARGNGPSDQLAASMRALYEMLLADEGLEETLVRVAEMATATLPTCDFADVTLIRNQRPVSKGATSPLANRLDQVQFSAGTGPCLDAWRRGEIVHVPSTRRDDRWPAFSTAAAAAGVMSTTALPLLVQHSPIGALNLYSLREDPWTEGDEEVAKLFAQQAAIALENARTHTAAVTLARQLAEALASRAEIEQAKGILMDRHNCSPEAAFERLMQKSQHENRKLRVIAGEIVRGVQQPRN